MGDWLKRTGQRLRRRVAGRLWFGRTAAPRPAPAAAATPARRQAVINRSLAEARLKLSEGDPAAAERAIRRARLAGCGSRELAMLATRAALRLGEPERALSIIERVERANADTELLYHLTRTLAGDRDGALIDLLGWSRRDDCPAAALVLAAWLCSERGDADAAERLLDDPRTQRDAVARQAAVAMAIARTNELPDEPTLVDLHHHGDGDADARAFAHTLGLPRRRTERHVPIDRVIQLAAELAGDPDAIETLVAAQRLRPRADRVSLLRRALVRVVDELARPITAIEALAELSRLAGDADDAWRWARRGLRLDPYNAKLALLMHDLANDERFEAQPRVARYALRRAAAAQPTWPDVQRALADRYRREGEPVLAIEQLYRLLVDRPGDAAATAMLTELAA